MTPQRTSGPDSGGMPKDQRNIQAAFGVGSVAFGAIAGLVAYRMSTSWALAVFVFLIGQYVVGRAVCDLITDPDRLRWALYFAILPVVAIGLLFGAYQIWGMTCPRYSSGWWVDG